MVEQRPLRLRQVVWVAHDHESAAATISGLLGLRPAFRDPAVARFGLENVVMPCGDQFVEVVSPMEEETAAGRLLDRRFGDGGYMVILETDDLEWVESSAAELNMRIAFRAEGDGIVGLHFHPSDVGATILSVDAGPKSGEWPWAGPDWRQHVDASVVEAIVAIELQATEPENLAKQWSDLLGRPFDRRSFAQPDKYDGRVHVRLTPVIELDNAEIRFVRAADGRGDGLRSVDFRAAAGSRSGEQRMIHGVEVNLI